MRGMLSDANRRSNRRCKFVPERVFESRVDVEVFIDGMQKHGVAPRGMRRQSAAQDASRQKAGNVSRLPEGTGDTVGAPVMPDSTAYHEPTGPESMASLKSLRRGTKLAEQPRVAGSSERAPRRPPESRELWVRVSELVAQTEKSPT